MYITSHSLKVKSRVFFKMAFPLAALGNVCCQQEQGEHQKKEGGQHHRMSRRQVRMMTIPDHSMELPRTSSISYFRAVVSKIENLLGYKLSLNRFYNMDIIQTIFSDYNWMKLEINNASKAGKLEIGEK